MDNGILTFKYWKTLDSYPDIRHEMRLLLQNAIFHASLLPLDYSSPETEIDWEGVRGWFDDVWKLAGDEPEVGKIVTFGQVIPPKRSRWIIGKLGGI